MRLSHAVLRAVWVALFALTVWFSLMPGSATPISLLSSIPGGDKFGHMSAYCALAFVPTLHERRYIALAFILVGLTLGVMMEIAQRLVPSRTFDWYDVLANISGLAIGTCCAAYIRARRQALR